MTSSRKKYSVKFWVAFWLVAAVLLTGWYFYLVRGKLFDGALSGLSERRNQLSTVWDIFNYFSTEDGRERTFLILIQNDMELRPGGGFLGSFGIVKIKDGKLADLQIHDTGIFDGRIPDGIPAPYPFERLIKIKDWKLRDSNFSPDFATNVNKTIEFYELGQGQEEFDGVIGINTRVLNPVLEITGPVQVEGYPGEFSGENAALNIEYQVEKAYREQDIDFTQRKQFLKDFAWVLIGKLYDLSLGEKIALAKDMEKELESKNVMLYFSDEALQSRIQELNWSGEVDTSHEGDYLMIVDANINGWKSDFYVRRALNYTVDLSAQQPIARLAITYSHTAKEKDWMTNNYQSFLRIYTPNGAWLESMDGAIKPVQFYEEFGKQVFGDVVQVKIGEQKTVTLEYSLPMELKDKPYRLLIQKQSGSGTVPTHIKVIDAGGQPHEENIQLEGDYVLEI